MLLPAGLQSDNGAIKIDAHTYTLFLVLSVCIDHLSSKLHITKVCGVCQGSGSLVISSIVGSQWMCDASSRVSSRVG